MRLPFFLLLIFLSIPVPLQADPQLDPSNPDYHFELANDYAVRYDRLSKSEKMQEEGRKLLEAMRQELEQALMIKPDDVPARYNLGIVYKREGEYEKAREEFRRVLELKPDLVAAQIQIGATYEEQGFFDEAEQAYRRAKEMAMSPEIDLALQDLKKHREEAEKQMKMQEASQSLLRGRRLEGSPYSSLRASLDGREPALASGQKIQQAIPYLGAWLVQELMKRREDKG